MSETILQYYNDELSHLRKQGAAFAESNPKIAGRLRLSPGASDDPFVGRLLESFAFLTARVRYKLDDELSTMTTALLNLLYPFYLLPVPSMSVMTFESQSQLDSQHEIPRHTQLVSQLPTGESCFFRTAYPVTLWPIKVSETKFSRQWHIKPASLSEQAKSCLRIKLETTAPEDSFYELKPDHLRFYLNGESRHMLKLYGLLCSQVDTIALSYPNQQGKTIELPLDAIQQVGFDESEALLPYPNHAFSGYRLLTEYFSFQDKFLFIDVNGLSEAYNELCESEVELLVYFKEAAPELESVVSNETFQLNSTPIVNLFEQKGEPIKVDFKQADYQIVPDVHRAKESVEVYQVLDVNAVAEQQYGEITCEPYFGKKFSQVNQAAQLYWYNQRKPAWSLGCHDMPGDECFLSVSDMQQQFRVGEQVILTPQLLCTNRDLAVQLPFGAHQPNLQFWKQGDEMVKSMRALRAITPPQYRHAAERSNIDLISHLAINQIGFSDHDDSLNLLKEILTLYHFNHYQENHLVQKGLVSLTTDRVMVRHPEQLKYGFCQGIELTLTVDEDHFEDNGAFLFGSVLNEFLARSCSINAFTQLVLVSQQRGEIHRWQPKLGIKRIL